MAAIGIGLVLLEIISLTSSLGYFDGVEFLLSVMVAVIGGMWVSIVLLDSLTSVTKGVCGQC